MSEPIQREESGRPALNNARRGTLLLLSICYAVLWAGGVAQYWLKGNEAADRGWLAAIFLTLAGVIALVGARTGNERLLLIMVALLGFVAEVIGVHLHVPFGTYSYTNALGPKLLGVPVVMAFAWMTLVAYVRQMLLYLRLAPWLEVITGALWVTAFDLLIDPLASNQLGYWRWSGTGAYFGVPLTNFAGWFAISLLAFLLLRKRFAPNLPARLAGFSLVVFFTLLAFGLGGGLVALIGCAVCLIHLLFIYARERRARALTIT